MSQFFQLALLALLPIACRQAQAQSFADPAHSDGDKYHVVLENARVRVLRYHDVPGDKTHMHHHPDFVMHALAPFKRKLTFPDGTTKTREFAAGDTLFLQAQAHLGENVGSTPTEALLVELKPGG